MDSELAALLVEDIYIKPLSAKSPTGKHTYGTTQGPIKAYVTYGRQRDLVKLDASVTSAGRAYVDGPDLTAIPDGSLIVLPSGAERPITEVHSWIDADSGSSDIDHWRITFGGG